LVVVLDTGMGLNLPQQTVGLAAVLDIAMPLKEVEQPIKVMRLALETIRLQEVAAAAVLVKQEQVVLQQGLVATV
jgi:hypothetical protein